MLNMSDHRQRLGALVEQRRLALGLSERAAATEAGMARNTWAALEGGTQAIRAHKHADIERVLQWAPGSIAAVLSGEDPVAENHGGHAGRAGEDPLIAEIWADPAFTDEQRMHLEQIVRRANADREMVAERLRRQQAG